jgi:hypothetical protein
MAADINGDGRADLVGFGGKGVYASLSLGAGKFGDPFLAIDSFGADAGAGGWTSNDRYPRMFADVNGDRKADLIGFGGLGIYAAAAKPDGHFEVTTFDLPGYGASDAAGAWISNDLFPRMLADANGDGLADVIGFGVRGVFIAPAANFEVIG